MLNDSDPTGGDVYINRLVVEVIKVMFAVVLFGRGDCNTVKGWDKFPARRDAQSL